jgi:hypothetical protein
MFTFLTMVALTIVQNASFTLVSRARNSGSLFYNGVASVLSNGIWLLVMVYVVREIESWDMRAAYILGATIGSVLMQWVAMRYLEKPKKPAARMALHGELETAFRLIERLQADLEVSFRLLTERNGRLNERVEQLEIKLQMDIALLRHELTPAPVVTGAAETVPAPVIELAPVTSVAYGTARMPEIEALADLSISLETEEPKPRTKPKRHRKPRAKKNPNPETTL